MSKIKTGYRIFYRSTFLCTTIIVGCLLTVFFQKGHMTRNSKSAKMTRWWHKKITQALSVPIKVFGSPTDRPTLFIANHISWFDIHAIGSTSAVRFLAKAEVKNMPVAGWLASRAGTLFISRGGKTAATKAIQTMAEALKQNQNIILFAEGTTTDGNTKRFHSRLIQSAIDAGCEIQPIAIRYPHHRELMHPAAPFIGEMSIGESLGNILRAEGLCAEVHYLDVVSTREKSRGELGRVVEGMVRGVVEKS